MNTLTDEAVKFILAIFEQSGSPSSLELGRLIRMTFSGQEPKLVMQAGLEAMKTTKGRVTIGDIQKHLDQLTPRSIDDHPTAEEAWALVPKNENETTHLTLEMADAMRRGGIAEYLDRQDFIGAERAFKKLYDENISKSRSAGRKAQWQLSLGHEKSTRIFGLERAISRGVIAAEKAIDADPDNEAVYFAAEKLFITRLPAEQQKALAVRLDALQANIKRLVAAKEEQTKAENIEEPCPNRMKDPIVIAKAQSLGLTPYEYLVRPCPHHIAAKVHAQLSKQYGIDLSTLTAKRR